MTGPYVEPDQRDADVPANTKVWIISAGHMCDSDPVQLLDGDGNVVPVTSSRLEHAALVLTPEADLEIGATYTLAGCNGAADMMGGPITVSQPADYVGPAVPSVTVGEWYEEDGETSELQYAYWDIQVQTDGDFVAVDIDGYSAVDPAGPSGTLTDLLSPTYVYIGRTGCHGNWNFEEQGVAPNVRFASVDFAGHFSDWSAPQDLEAGCGCRIVGPRSARGGLGIWGLVLLAVALTRRRNPSLRHMTTSLRLCQAGYVVAALAAHWLACATARAS